eukprot:jgi/Botrbrau1/12986/Bobra.384_1s0011.1
MSAEEQRPDGSQPLKADTSASGPSPEAAAGSKQAAAAAQMTWAKVVANNKNAAQEEPERLIPGSKEQKPARPAPSDPGRRPVSSQPATPVSKSGSLRVRSQPPPAQKPQNVSTGEQGSQPHLGTEPAAPSSVISTAQDAPPSVSGTTTSDASPKAAERDSQPGPGEGSAPNSKANTPRFQEAPSPSKPAWNKPLVSTPEAPAPMAGAWPSLGESAQRPKKALPSPTVLPVPPPVIKQLPPAKPAAPQKPRKERPRSERPPPAVEASQPAIAPHSPPTVVEPRPQQEVRVLQPPAAKPAEPIAPPLERAPPPPTTAQPVERPAPPPPTAAPRPERGPERVDRIQRPSSTPPVLPARRNEPASQRGANAGRGRGLVQVGPRPSNEGFTSSSRPESVVSEPGRPERGHQPEYRPVAPDPFQWGRGEPGRGRGGGRGGRGRMGPNMPGIRAPIGNYPGPQGVFFPQPQPPFYRPGYPLVPLPVAYPSVEDTLRVQIEYYFSAQNLVKDMFLRRKMDDEGWVPLEAIAKFNRVRQVTLDITLIASALRPSTVVELAGESSYVVRARENWRNWILPPAERDSEATSSMQVFPVPRPGPLGPIRLRLRRARWPNGPRKVLRRSMWRLT